MFQGQWELADVNSYTRSATDLSSSEHESNCSVRVLFNYTIIPWGSVSFVVFVLS